jgi:signal transduction histidine kinase
MSGRSTGPSVETPRLVMSTLGWVRKAVSFEDATVQVLLPDGAGRLRVIASDGRAIVGGRLRSRRRRRVFETLRTQRVPLREPPGWSIGMYPLIAEGDAIGVMEVVAPGRNLEDRREEIEAVVGQSANVFRSVAEGQERADDVRSMAIMLRLATDLLQADTSSAAVGSTVHRCFEQLGVPVVGLLPDPSRMGWFVASARGVGAKRRVQLGRETKEIGAFGQGRETRDRLAAMFAGIVGCDRGTAIDAGDALLLTVDVPPDRIAMLEMASSLLAGALDHIDTVGLARARNEQLDFALACTAHELRGPLVGARAALDHVEIDDPGPQSRELLRQTKDELGQLADLVDPLLRWSVGTDGLRTSTVDLVRLVHDAVASCSLDPGCAEVLIEAPEHLMVDADGPQLRGAIGNVVRNALAYSPMSAPVTIVVEERPTVALVRVRDRGPGVPAQERERIFDPFVRGGAGATVRDGRGLGLFIARRIIEAHGGCIGLRPVRPGVEFCVELPTSGAGGQSSAS